MSKKTIKSPPQKDEPLDDGEQFEISMLGIIKFKCKRFTIKAIVALIVVLLFIGLMAKL